MSSRKKAEQFGVHRNTVITAYDELIAQGWLVTERARGTFVNNELPELDLRGGVQRRPDQPAFTLPRALIADGPAERDKRILSMAGGMPDMRLIPHIELARAFRRVLTRNGSALLDYGDPRGQPRLRAALRTMLAEKRGLVLDDDEIIVTQGSQMALYLAGRALVRPGAVIAVEALGYRPAWRAFRAVGARLAPVRLDADGLSIDALEKLLAKKKLSAVYLTPHHQYPTTATLSASRRLALAALAKKHRFAIIEDDYDHEFHYGVRPILPMASNDSSGSVIYIGTLSKVLAPGLRIGYIAAPRAVIAAITAHRERVDHHGPPPIEAAVAELIEDGDLNRHAAKMRRAYNERRDALNEAMSRSLKGVLSWNVPPGGMALWAKVTPDIDAEAWAERARDRGVDFATARRFTFTQKQKPFIRVGYALRTPVEIRTAVKRMAAALRTR